MVFLVQEALVKINSLESLMLDLKQRGLLSPDDKKEMDDTLAKAKEELHGMKFVRGWITGGGAQSVWGYLHNVEQHIDRLETDPDPVISRAWINGKASLPDARMAKYDSEIVKATSDKDKLKLARALSAEAHEEDATRHSSERHWQRNVFFTCGAAILGAAVALVIQSLFPSIQLLPQPTTEGSPSGILLVLLVMLCGSLGGFLGGFYKLYIRDKKLGNTRWNDVKPVLMFANVTLGIWTAYIGVLLVGMEMIVGKYQNLGAALLLAIIFGMGQLTVTKYLEEKAAEMLKIAT